MQVGVQEKASQSVSQARPHTHNEESQQIKVLVLIDLPEQVLGTS